jgi:hypothetical protein
MEKKTLALIAGMAISNPFSFFLGSKIGAAYPFESRQQESWLVYHSYKPASGFHENPWDLRINYHINRENELEVYLVDTIRGKGAPIGNEVYPPAPEMCRKLVEKGIISATDVKTYLPDIILEGAAFQAGKGIVEKLWR